jgi:ribosomal-protein-alanine N-acetyltransferase
MMELFSPGYAGPALRLTGAKVLVRPAEMEDFMVWSGLRAQSRAFLEPWEPTWPADALTRSAWQRRIKRQYEDWRHDAAYNLLVFRLGDNAVVGGLSLTNVRRGVSQTAALGYWVGQPHVRKGYISEAVSLLLTQAFGEWALHRIEAGCLPTNIASRGLLQKLGFREEGYARSYLRINGKWEDHLLFAMLREEWAGSNLAP